MQVGPCQCRSHSEELCVAASQLRCSQCVSERGTLYGGQARRATLRERPAQIFVWLPEPDFRSKEGSGNILGVHSIPCKLTHLLLVRTDDGLLGTNVVGVQDCQLPSPWKERRSHPGLNDHKVRKTSRLQLVAPRGSRKRSSRSQCVKRAARVRRPADHRLEGIQLDRDESLNECSASISVELELI